MNRALSAFLRWLVVLALPVFIVLLSARVMVNTWYPRFEYAKPDFPPDPYGFAQVQRLALATTCIDFLNAPVPPEIAITMLAALRLPDTEQPLFTIYELGHMVDVKRLTDMLWRVWIGAGIIVLAGFAGLAARRRTRQEGYAALFGGGLLTTVLLIGLIAFVLFGWRTFFIAFHDAFFPPGTWTFDWSNSLIRLFPDRFWFDAGVLLVGGALVVGLLALLAGYLLGRRARLARK